MTCLKMANSLDSFQPKIIELKKQFPVLQEGFVYLDHAATSQKPRQVIDVITDFYTNQYATIHRGVYQLSQNATDLYEQTRSVVKNFINAKNDNEIVIVKGATEAINLVATSYGDEFIQEGDEIIITELEHHANIVPWQQLCNRKGAVIKVLPIHDDGELDIAKLDRLLSDKTALVAVNHVSNSLGTINPIKEIIKKVRVGSRAKVLVDGCQAASHLKIDVLDLDCDFYCFSSHKCFGPTGVGILYGKFDLLDAMRPYQTGGDMIDEVSYYETSFAPVPAKFEAGTPAITEVIAFAEAIKFIESIGLDFIEEYERLLLDYATDQIKQIPGLTVIGTAKNKSGIISFVMDGIHPHDIGSIVDSKNVAIRVGHHCTQPLMKRLGLSSTARLSFSIYTTKDDIDKCIESIKEVIKVFG